jgi:CheY-like chemotaxis protein
MTIAEQIAPHLPFLRRFARAVTGSQTSGDAYVAAVLEALIADVSIFPQASSDRIATYKLFSSLFGSIAIEFTDAQSPYAWEQRASQNLLNIAPKPRQAFILSAVEGFDIDAVGEILGASRSEVEHMLSQASREISQQVATDILIIEDEPLIAMDIEEMVQSIGHRVTGIARTRKEAVELFRNQRPNMILADIQLADGSSGIDAVNEILETADIPVIFITAFPERLLTGDRPEPTFLVTKPFNPEMVKALISQALFFNKAKVKAA